MSYQVLARKWRPRAFAEMVGQEHVLRALINALDNDRLHHAFLFTGTRGVGKTTIARILAKSLNCEQGVSSRPCGTCSACREIDEGRFVDLVEVDAASRTKVEDTRELLDNVQYAPSRGRYKVYLIDEVHMLSNHSFNALLKTLEEPPPHVKFLLATTDPQRLPVTILSRCLQFNLKRLPLELIRGHLTHILAQEGIAAETAALSEIARSADGSMRDALSLLDQAIAYGGDGLRLAEVQAMLGAVDRTYVAALARALARGDAAALLAEAAALAERAPDFAGVLNELNGLWQRVALAHVLPQAVDDSLGERETVLELAGATAAEDVQLFYQIGISGRRDLPLAPDARSGFEMVLLRMLAFRPAETGPAGVRGGSAAGGAAAGAPAAGRSAEPRPQPAAPRAAPSRAVAASLSELPPPVAAPPVPAPPVAAPPTAAPAAAAPPAVAPPAVAPPAVAPPAVAPPAVAPPAVAPPAVAPPVAAPPVAAAAVATDAGEWESLVKALPLNGMSRQVALHCALAGHSEGHYELVLDKKMAQMHQPKWADVLSEALSTHFGRAVKATIQLGEPATETPDQARQRRAAAQQQAAEQSVADDPLVKAMLDRFDGRIEPGSIRPLDQST